MFTDIAIWSSPPPPAHYRVEGTAAHPHREYTDAEYVPAKTYSRALVQAGHVHPKTVETVPTEVHVATAAEFVRSQSGIHLYASVANYRPPAPALVSLSV